jgi:hypothetical protein
MFKQFTSSAKSWAVPLLGMAGLSLAPAVAQAAETFLDTSVLWSDADSYHACNLSNTSKSSIMVYVALIDANGAITQGSLTTPSTVLAGSSIEVTDIGSANGFARCRFGVYNPAIVRANMMIFHPSGGDYQIYATSEAR